ncbi:MAG: NAD-dependent epimerase/dehydratase family protein [Actinobacteria bacterium]|nr:NAD-dependent epimerase/dehydratase family protein [Actinomycetota bacterium]
MKVLISGGYNFIGSTLAAKFIKEGHNVTVIDKLNHEGYGRAARERYKFYNLSNSSPECEKIFGAGRFEIVIHIPEYESADITSPKLPASEDILSSCNASGLVNMLDLSTKNKVKKFVLFSSSEIYGNTGESPASEETVPNPVSLKGMSSYVMEYYCFRWGEINNLNILSLRVSNFYGPQEQMPESLLKPQDVVSIFLDRILQDEGIIINGSGTQTRDFMYIDDLIDGAYKASASKDCSGIFNLSSKVEHSINSLIENLSALKKPHKIIYQKNFKEKIQRAWLDNSKISGVIGWEPKVSFEEGIKITYKWKQLQKEAKKRKRHGWEKAEENHKKKGIKATAYIENIILFLLVAFMQWGNLFFNIKMPVLKIDYSIIYIIIMGIMWGQTQAYIAMILSVILYVGMSLFTGADIVTFVYTPENLIRIAAYILVGIVTGYSIERKNRELESRNLLIQNLQNKYMFLSDIYNETRIVKNELENQIIETEDSFSAIYKIIQEVDSLEIEKVFSGAISAIERIMRTNQVSIYTLSNNGSNNFMRLKARSLVLLDKVPNSIKISDFEPLRQVVQTKSIYINRDFISGMPVMIAPVLEDKNVIAVISVHSTPFENLTLHYQNLFQTVVGLITNALKRAYFFEASLKDKRYIPNTRILTSFTFEKILKEIQNNKTELGMSYTLLQVERNDRSLEEISEKVVRVIRDNDYIGTSVDDNVYILLSNTKNNYAGLVLERLQKAEIIAYLVLEDFDDE